jgi:hypothetical protein
MRHNTASTCVAGAGQQVSNYSTPPWRDATACCAAPHCHSMRQHWKPAQYMQRVPPCFLMILLQPVPDTRTNDLAARRQHQASQAWHAFTSRPHHTEQKSELVLCRGVDTQQHIMCASIKHCPDHANCRCSAGEELLAQRPDSHLLVPTSQHASLCAWPLLARK